MNTTIQPDHAGSLPPARQRAIETFYGVVQRWTDGALEQVLTPDWEDVPLAPGQQPGPSGVKPIFTMLQSAIADLEIRIVEVLADGDHAACRLRLSGTHVADLFGVPASGRKVAFASHEFHLFAGDRIRRTHHLEDLFGLFSQIGAFPDASGGAPS